MQTAAITPPMVVTAVDFSGLRVVLFPAQVVSACAENEYLTLLPQYLSDFFPLQTLHSIWQLSMVVCPPLLQGLIWSPSISSNSKCSLQTGHIPFCLLYAASLSRLSNARKFNNLPAKGSVSRQSKNSYMPLVFVPPRLHAAALPRRPWLRNYKCDYGIHCRDGTSPIPSYRRSI